MYQCNVRSGASPLGSQRDRIPQRSTHLINYFPSYSSVIYWILLQAVDVANSIPFVFQTLAVLAAVTEVIKSQGGSENETTYFAALVIKFIWFMVSNSILCVLLHHRKFSAINILSLAVGWLWALLACVLLKVYTCNMIATDDSHRDNWKWADTICNRLSHFFSYQKVLLKVVVVIIFCAVVP